MTDKAYIVANEQQEMSVLRIMEQQGYTWNDGDIPTHCMPSHYAQLTFPYVLTNHNFIGWLSIDDTRLVNFKVLYDGRKEEKMSEKYVVSQKFMNELEEWRDEYILNAALGRWAECVDGSDLSEVPEVVINWWVDKEMPIESNNRLIAIIRWVNGEDVFEVEKPKKWVVRSKETDSEGSHLYVNLSNVSAIPDITTYFGLESATRFDTKEEAESWANAHQEVLEVVDVCGRFWSIWRGNK